MILDFLITLIDKQAVIIVHEVWFAIAVPTLFWIYDHYRTLTREAVRLELEYENSQKYLIKRYVDETVDFISFKKSQAETRVKSDLKMRVNEAHAIATHLFEIKKNSLSESELKSLIIEAIRPLRFNNGRGYFFATAFDGTSMLFADRVELEGQNLFNMQDTQGKFVVREMIDLTRKHIEGYITYTWTKPDAKGRTYPKIAFVKHFEPFDWFIGTGEYLDDVEAEIKNEALARIGNIRFGTDGYVFVMDYDYIMHSHILTKLIGTSMVGVTAPDGLKINEELVKAAKKKGGDYLSYSWHKPSENRNVEKISFARGFSPWEWVVASGVYLDDIEQSVSVIRAKARNRLVREMGIIFLIFFLLMILSCILVRSISQRIHNEFSVFSKFFDQSADESVPIREASLNFTEFKDLAGSANKMVSKRMEVEKENVRIEKRYRELLRDIRDGILVTTKNGKIVDANQALLDLLDYSREQFLELTAVDIYGSTEERLKLLAILDLKGTVSNYELTIRGKDNLPIDCLLSAAVRRNSNDDIVGYHGIFRDMTEHKKLLEREQHRQKLESIGTLAGGIAHDFNNILSAIIGYSELAKLELPDSYPVREHIDEVLKASNRAKDLVQHILSFSRKEVGKLLLVQINLITQEALKLLRATIPTTIEIIEKIDPDCGYILADPTQIHQVIMNLCTNASQAMGDNGGILEINVSPAHFSESDMIYWQEAAGLTPGNYVKISVSDTGPGIDSQVITRIFDPYFTTKETGKGSGMGLAVAHGIIQSCDGLVEVKSEVGKGTGFHVYFPKFEQEKTENGAIVEPEGLLEGGSERILVVDDEESLVAIHEKRLRNLGYTVTASMSSKDGLELFRDKTEAFDLVITDQTMPKMTGMQLAQEIKSIKPDMPIILCTGYSSSVNQEKAREIGISAFIMKPIEYNEFTKTIRQVLTEKG